jgi:Ca2+-binding EF-hand superfamily protein
MLAWDRDGDGKVSVQDVLTMKQAMAKAQATAEQQTV